MVSLIGVGEEGGGGPKSSRLPLYDLKKGSEVTQGCKAREIPPFINPPLLNCP
jgi:hypothetical protein